MAFGIGNVACSQPINESWLPSGGLKLYLDANNAVSYPGGPMWYDLSGNNNNFTINPAAFKTEGNVKYMDFNGSYGCAKKADSDMIISGNVTAIVWTRVLTSNGTWRTLFRGNSSGGDHQVIIQAGGYNLGMYDNTNGQGFIGTGFDVRNIIGYGTTKWLCLVWRWNNSIISYYNYSYADTPIYIPGYSTNVYSRFKHGFCSIGAYQEGNQSNPMVASQFWGDISSVMMWDRVLTQEEVVQVYRGTRMKYNQDPNMIVDNGFEVPNQGSSFTYQPGGTIWTLNPNCGYTGPNNVFQSGTSKDGNNCLFMQSATAWTSQSINTIPNKVYKVSVWGKSRVLTWGPLAFDITHDGIPLGNSGIYFPQTDQTWSQYVGYFTASNTSTQLGFVGVNPVGGDRSVLLDLVEVSEV